MKLNVDMIKLVETPGIANAKYMQPSVLVVLTIIGFKIFECYFKIPEDFVISSVNDFLQFMVLTEIEPRI